MMAGLASNERRNLHASGRASGRPAAWLVPGLQMRGDVVAGRYRVEALLGVGGSGFVVAARHVHLQREVTLKILTSRAGVGPAARDRAFASARAAAAMRSVHVARILETGFTDDGAPFLATERLAGRTLADELAVRRALPAAEAVRWVLQACDALAEAHAAGIVHGDLKLRNLFLADNPEGRLLKVLDFGMASPFSDADAGAGAEAADEATPSACFASPAYMAPEQVFDPAHVDGRADVWALGVILHELVAGCLPFEAETVSGMLVAIARDEPAPLVVPGVPYEIASVVRQCLAKNPAERFLSIGALARALAPFAAGPDPAASIPPGATDVESFSDDGEPTIELRERRVLAMTAEEEASQPPDGMKRRPYVATIVLAAAAFLALVEGHTPDEDASASSVEVAGGGAARPPWDPGPPDRVARSVNRDRREPPSIAEPSPSEPCAPPPLLHEAAPGATNSLPVDVRGAGRSRLHLRENPYERGFTHPSRLAPRIRPEASTSDGELKRPSTLP